MKVLAWICAGLLLGVTSACTVAGDTGVGAAGDNGNGGETTTSILPEPDNRSGDSLALTPEQQKRKEEAERYVVENIYQGDRILRTVEDDSGDTIDWIGTNTMAALPDSPPELPWSLDQLVLPEGVEFAVNELEQHPELFGPVGSTPFHRPTYWDYILGATDATSIEDYLERHQFSGAPAAQNRLYAGLISSEQNRGVSGSMNQFQPRVEKDSFSILEFAVFCPAPEAGPAEELIGVVISVDKANGFGKKGLVQDDGKPRLHVEHYRQRDGKFHYVWDKRAPGFVPNPFSLHPLGDVVPVSTPGGKQVEHRVDIVQVPVTGDWWIAYNGFSWGIIRPASSPC